MGLVLLYILSAAGLFMCIRMTYFYFRPYGKYDTFAQYYTAKLKKQEKKARKK